MEKSRQKPVLFCRESEHIRLSSRPDQFKSAVGMQFDDGGGFGDIE